jgi:hypothetical protein
VNLSVGEILVTLDHPDNALHLVAAIGSLRRVALADARLADVETAFAGDTFCVGASRRSGITRYAGPSTPKVWRRSTFDVSGLDESGRRRA